MDTQYTRTPKRPSQSPANIPGSVHRGAIVVQKGFLHARSLDHESAYDFTRGCAIRETCDAPVVLSVIRPRVSQVRYAHFNTVVQQRIIVQYVVDQAACICGYRTSLESSRDPKNCSVRGNGCAHLERATVHGHMLGAVLRLKVGDVEVLGCINYVVGCW